METIVDRIRTLCIKNKTSITKLEVELGYANGTIGKWAKGKRTPPLEKVIAIAGKLNTTTDYLYYGTEKAPTPKSEGEEFEEAMKVALFGGSGEVTPEMWEEVKQFARMVMLRVESDKKNGRNA